MAGRPRSGVLTLTVLAVVAASAATIPGRHFSAKAEDSVAAPGEQRVEELRPPSAETSLPWTLPTALFRAMAGWHSISTVEPPPAAAVAEKQPDPEAQELKPSDPLKLPRHPHEPVSLTDEWQAIAPPAPDDAAKHAAADDGAKREVPDESAKKPIAEATPTTISAVNAPAAKPDHAPDKENKKVDDSVRPHADAKAQSTEQAEIPTIHPLMEMTPFCQDQARDCTDCLFDQRWLPDGLLYKSYLAGEKEPRFASQWLNEAGRGLVWESALGGRVGIYRKGTFGSFHPQGWQIDLEGAVFARIDPEEKSDPLQAADFQFGLLWTRRCGPTAWKAGYTHISSHLGDEFLIANPGFERLNYVRDSAIVGVMHDITPDLSVYFETAVAPSPSGGAEPLEFQFGSQYSPARPSGKRGDPFAAVNVHLRQEFDFGGSINAEAGWQWRSVSDRLLRIGIQHYNGKSMQYSFFDENESLTGLGLWLDY